METKEAVHIRYCTLTVIALAAPALTVWLAASKAAPAPNCSLDWWSVLTFNQ
jgi:hypothetical protein